MNSLLQSQSFTVPSVFKLNKMSFKNVGRLGVHGVRSVLHVKLTNSCLVCSLFWSVELRALCGLGVGY